MFSMNTSNLAKGDLTHAVGNITHRDELEAAIGLVAEIFVGDILADHRHPFAGLIVQGQGTSNRSIGDDNHRDGHIGDVHDK